MPRPCLQLGLALLFLTPLCAVDTAAADTRGDKIMKLLDTTMTLARDQRFTYDLITLEPGKAERKLVMDVRVKGSTWRRVDFVAPGDVKGMKVLVLSQSKMYVYLPAYRKVRRVASHVKDQGFMGTTLSHDDISTVTYGKYYHAKFLGETNTHYKIVATRREGMKVPYPKLEFDILKKYNHPSEIRYFNDKGKKIKTEARTGYSCQGKICNAAEMKMTDHVRNGAWTKMVRKRWKVNIGIKDRIFSLRSLQRGR